MLGVVVRWQLEGWWSVKGAKEDCHSDGDQCEQRFDHGGNTVMWCDVTCHRCDNIIHNSGTATAVEKCSNSCHRTDTAVAVTSLALSRSINVISTSQLHSIVFTPLWHFYCEVSLWCFGDIYKQGRSKGSGRGGPSPQFFPNFCEENDNSSPKIIPRWITRQTDNSSPI